MLFWHFERGRPYKYKNHEKSMLGLPNGLCKAYMSLSMQQDARFDVEAQRYALGHTRHHTDPNLAG